MEFYSVIKRKEALINATTWMSLEKIMLREVSHKRSHFVWLHLYEMSTIGIFVEMECSLVISGVLWRENGE